ncbi:MAG: N-acetylglucosamine kinase [Cyclobacteriaceae bacterium]
MILIADSGSTKTEWRVIDGDGNVSQIRTSGINPYYQEENAIAGILEAELDDHLGLPVEKVFFYGAGCSTQESRDKVANCFATLMPGAECEVSTDMLAAARSLCGHQPGIACILGTGSNSCLYDGVSIVENVPSLGYILGDEGSGSYLGNRLLGHFIRKELPTAILAKMDKRFELSRPVILENVYQKPAPARYMAGFSKFIFQNISDPFLYKMVYDGFMLFFEKNIMKYTDYKKEQVHFTGSVAFYYTNILRKVAADLGINVKHIVEGPIAGLTLYHQKQLNK